ncbi:unnamed protein product [Prorocentrum cordatum]|uniref:Uncharacterized protein n=1 Tax=Prorocentrum cordatum TaxID=2364126 RepID=A0ABN9TIE2_9DINO|nr:unnamed protein product [Polarella glacialis]
MEEGLAEPLPIVPPEEAQIAAAFFGPRWHARVPTPEAPACSETDGRGGPSLAAGKSCKVNAAGLGVNVCDALSAPSHEDEDQLQTARDDGASEKFYCQFAPEESTRPRACTVNLGIAPPWGTQAQRAPANDFACFYGPPQRASMADCPKDFRRELKNCATGGQVSDAEKRGRFHRHWRASALRKVARN